MNFIVIAHGSYTINSGTFVIPENCSICFYEKHNDNILFTDAHYVVRGLLLEDAMEMDETTINTSGQVLTNYDMSFSGMCPIWQDLGISALDIYHYENVNGELVLVKHNIANNTSRTLEQVVNYINRFCPNQFNRIDVISCRSFTI